MGSCAEKDAAALATAAAATVPGAMPGVPGAGAATAEAPGATPADEPLRTYSLTLGYNGAPFAGFARQPGQLTVQGNVEEALSLLFKQPVLTVCAGRTDAGVHALRQIANFRIPRIMSRYSCQKIQDYFNQYLPQDIRVLAVEQVPERFHARLSASSKLYEYRIDCGEVANIFQRRYLLRVEDKLNLEHMREAADLLTGTHDFKSFCANRHMKKSTVRTIYEITFEENDGILSIRYHGDGFLYNMVRILTGTLLEVGLGERSLPEVRLALEGKDRSLAGFTAPPQGLFLVDVFYPVAEEERTR